MATVRSPPAFTSEVTLSHFKSYPWTPLLCALQLFHPVLLLRSLFRWALHDFSVALVLAGVVFTLPLLLAVLFPVACLVGLIYCFGGSRKSAPLVITPASNAHATPEYLAAFVDNHRESLHKAADQFGAVLFRGFNLGSEIQNFEAVLAKANMRPTEFFGQAPRKQENGWKYVFRNIAFEAGGSQSGLYTEMKRRLGVVWSWAPMFFNFHNEMAYLKEANHLGKYGVFCCRYASECGGYTPLADARRVHARLKNVLPEMPEAMKWVLSRKKREAVPRKASGGYIEYLLGEFELEGVPDQFWPNRKVEEIFKLASELDLEVCDTPGEDIVVWSKWIEPSRRVPGSTPDDVTWWCNGNHVTVGSHGPVSGLLPWRFRFSNGLERPATVKEVFRIAYCYWMEASFFQWEQGDMVIFNNQLVAHDATPGTGKRMVMPSFGDCF